MTERILIKGGIVLTQDPAARRAAARRHPRRGRQDRRGRPGPERPTARRSSTPPATSSSPASSTPIATRGRRRSGRARRTSRWSPTSARSSTSSRPHYRPEDVLRGEPLGRPRVHQRGHHDARRLVAHHEHAGPRRRRDQGPPGHRHPIGLRVRLPEHVAPGLVVRAGLGRQRRADRRRPGPHGSEAPAQRRPRPHHDGPRHARHELLQARCRAVRVGARQGARHQHHRPRRDGPVRLHEDAGRRASRTWACSTRTRPTSTRRT